MTGEAIPDVTVCIVNYRSAGLLNDCLQTVPRAMGTYRYEVIVIDNSGEVDDTAPPNGLQFYLLRNTSNVGFARAVNQGIRASCGRYVLLLNPDALLTDSAVSELVRFMDQRPEVAAVGPQIVFPNGEPQPSAQSFPTLFTLVGHLFGLKWLLPWAAARRFFARLLRGHGVVAGYVANYIADAPREVDWCSGACMLVRREAMDAIGLFDEDYFLYYEDVDLCRRLRQRGWRIWHNPRAVVTHRVGGSVRGFDGETFISRYRSAIRYFSKYHPAVLPTMYLVMRTAMVFRLVLWEGVARICPKRRDAARKRISAVRTVYGLAHVNRCRQAVSKD